MTQGKPYQPLDPHVLNYEPAPQATLSRSLEETLRNIDKDTQGKIRLPMATSRNHASVRIISDDGHDVSSKRGSTGPASARTYKPKDSVATVRPMKGASDSERAYIWR